MKKILLVLICTLLSVNSFAIFGIGKKKNAIPDEIEPVQIVKQCFYQMEARPNVYGIFTVLQQECSGISLAGVVSGRMIIEYDESLDVINEQSPKTDEAFRAKVNSLWPDMQEIKFKQ